MGRRRWILHGLAWIVGAASFRVALIPPQSCRSVGVDEVSEAIDLAAGWAARNVLDGGTYTYRYDRDAADDLGGYNVVRHAALVNALYQAADAGESEYLEAADLGLGFMLDHLVTHADWVAFADPASDVRLGGTALFLASLVHRRRATGDVQHDDTMHAAARFLIAQQDSTGAPLAFWDPVTALPTPERFGPFATGEAAWALALMETDFPAQGYGAAADAVIAYVVNDRRSREDLILRIPDHWISYAFAERNRPLSPTELTYVERLAGDFALMSRVEAQRGDSGIQAFVRYGHALGAGVGAMGEGIAGLWRVADAGRALADERDDLTDRVECVTSILVDRQVGLDDVRGSQEFELGAWFRNDITQMDDQQHSISALLWAREILERESGR